MASIILSSVGASLGNAIPVVGPLVGAAIGRTVGGAVGGFIDDAIFGSPGGSSREGPRLSDLSVQVSTYGKMVPLVFGSVRIAGNVIWSRPIKETATTSTSSSGGGKGGGGGGSKTTATTYSYSVTLAIAICEGEVTNILRAWADAEQLDLSQGAYRIYKGDEGQLPDPVIESFEGVGSTPAYRGLCYVVIEDFPLANYGNRIPNFTFEVKRTLKFPDYDGQAVEDMVTGIIMIPGAGEFVYDTQIDYKVSGELVGADFVQRSTRAPINRHTIEERANALISLDHLADTCPNVGWIGVVACWFGTSLDAGDCIIKPGVEYVTGAITEPEVWNVGGFNRDSAHAIAWEGDSPRYGGTPDDQSLLRYLTEVKSRGYNILFLPLFFMDVENKPWRGRVTGTPSEVSNFFTKTNGYNAFITHYANLVGTHVDAFAIGSEMIGLTKVTDMPGNYPAVNQLVSLAATVKGIVGGDVQVTYAADWSEYHHTDGGWYNLDPLWASPNIDFIGIDAYFPLTDAPQSDLGYDVEQVIDGWDSGEGYDFYYSDIGRTVQSSLSPAYAWKNIEWFWSNVHHNPGGAVTSWVPELKKIWFTEFGFPSVDGATNQPNVFYDPTSSESYFPYHSRGRVDFRAQRMGITGTLARWQGSDMVERAFLWTWDARPFPYFPDLLSVWADGPVWVTGHWVTGKLGLSALAAIIRNLCHRAGLMDEMIDVSRLLDRVDGYVVTRPSTVRSLIEELMSGFFFDAVESEGVLKFTTRGGEVVATIDANDLLPADGNLESLQITRRQELELPREMDVVYLNRQNLYQPGTQAATRQVTESRELQTIALSVVMEDQQAKNIADIALYLRWLERTQYQFWVDDAQAALEPTDIIVVEKNSVSHQMRILSTLRDSGRMRISAVAEDVSVYDVDAPPGEVPGVVTPPVIAGETVIEFLDIPALPGDVWMEAKLRFAMVGRDQNWRGGVLYRSEDGGANYARLTSTEVPAVVGTVSTVLAAGPRNRFDEVNELTVLLVGEGELESVTELALLNGANAALVGEEIIQFQSVEEIEAGKYVLSRLLRGRLGTEHAMAGHAVGERFVLLDYRLLSEPLLTSQFGRSLSYKPVSLGATLGNTDAVIYASTARSLKPYSPVHVSGSRDGSGNLTILWVRRARLSGEWRDYADAAISESREAYEVDIMNGSSVARTLSSTSPLATYSASQQIADFGSLQSSVTVRIYQLSELVGCGTAAEAVI